MYAPIDLLPPELLHIISQVDMATYYGLICAYPRFARLITNGIRFDYAELFGVDYHITSKYGKCEPNPYWTGNWTLNGKLHRADGPAEIYANYMRYRIRGKMHRVDGPAVITIDETHKEYWINGQFLGNDESANIQQ